MAVELNDYIIKAREKHFTDDEIEEKLIAAGWPKEQVTHALLEKNKLPDPPPPPITNHADVWMGILYFLFFIALYILVFTIGGTFYIWIDKIAAQTTASTPTVGTNINPCPNTGQFGPLCNLNNNSISPVLPFDVAGDVISLTQGYVAAIMVSYPVFVILALILKKQIAKQPMLKNLRSRKILIYITVILSFIIMIGAIITAWYNFLAGNLNNINIRHTIIIFLITGSLFAYFLSEVKMTKILPKKDTIAFIFLTVLTGIALVYGFTIIPSPAMRQKITNDHKRVIDLGSLQTSIDNYYQQYNTLPKSLIDVITYNANSDSTQLNTVDPQTKQPYEYIVSDSLDYKLCATFSTSSSEDDPNGYDDSNYDYATFSSQFIHQAGHQCFNESETPVDTSGDNEPTPVPYCTGDCPSPTPFPYPSRIPCKEGTLCPMIPANQPSPAIYNNGNQTVTPTPAPSGGGSAG